MILIGGGGVWGGYGVAGRRLYHLRHTTVREYMS